jgi:hypothetical protein
MATYFLRAIIHPFDPSIALPAAAVVLLVLRKMSKQVKHRFTYADGPLLYYLDHHKVFHASYETVFGYCGFPLD